MILLFFGFVKIVLQIYYKGGNFINRIFIAEVKKQLSIRRWKYADLAKATGYTRTTIEAFMIGKRDSENMIKAIATALEIEI